MIPGVGLFYSVSRVASLLSSCSSSPCSPSPSSASSGSSGDTPSPFPAPAMRSSAI